MNVRRALGLLVAISLITASSTIAVMALLAVVAARRPAVAPAFTSPPFDGPGFAQFTMLRHAEASPAADSNGAVHPLFNARSCAECHRQGGVGGAGSNANNVRLINKSLLPDNLGWKSHFGAGPEVAVLHHRSSSAEYDKWRLDLIWKLAPNDSELTERVQLRLKKVTHSELFQAGPLRTSASNRVFEQRNTPPLFGLGLIESIPQREIDAVARSQPGPIRGRSPRLQGGGHGRFGWKSNTATLAAFNENACAVELGLSTPRFKPAFFQPAIFRPTPLKKWPDEMSASPSPATGVSQAVDMTDDDLAALTRFVAGLPAPRQVFDPAMQVEVAKGSALFHNIGCAVCHQPNLGTVRGLYSDLLLHSLGASGGVYYGGPTPSPSGRQPDFDFARGDEFRTHPLWGVADSAPYLHDGSAGSLEEAVLAHHGQASASNVVFQKLSSSNQRRLLIFLQSLRAPAEEGRALPLAPDSNHKFSELPTPPPLYPSVLHSLRANVN